MKKALFAFIVLLLVGCAVVQETTQVQPTETKTIQENTVTQGVKGNKILIIECKGTPEILEIQQGEMLIFQNADVREHIITIADKELTVPSGGATQIQAKFFAGKRDYKYNCDSNENIGTVIVN